MSNTILARNENFISKKIKIPGGKVRIFIHRFIWFSVIPIVLIGSAVWLWSVQTASQDSQISSIIPVNNLILLAVVSGSLGAYLRVIYYMIRYCSIEAEYSSEKNMLMSPLIRAANEKRMRLSDDIVGIDDPSGKPGASGPDSATRGEIEEAGKEVRAAIASRNDDHLFAMLMLQARLSNDLRHFIIVSPMTYEWLQLIIGAVLGIATFWALESNLLALVYTLPGGQDLTQLKVTPGGVALVSLIAGLISAEVLKGTERQFQMPGTARSRRSIKPAVLRLPAGVMAKRRHGNKEAKGSSSGHTRG
jgi:hypothetical protein